MKNYGVFRAQYEYINESNTNMMNNLLSFVLLLSLYKDVTPFLGQFQRDPAIISSSTTTLFLHNGDADKTCDEEDVDFLEHLEKARESFESLVAKPHLFNDSPATTLTAASRKRREIEIGLMESLRDADDAVDELVNLWMQEKGESQANYLKEMEKSCSDGLLKEEELLRNMIEDSHNEWAEPISRLAAILFYKGRSVESKEHADFVLRSIKPWHFECAQLQVMNCLRLGLRKEAFQYARMALPSLNHKTNNSARNQWVDSALRAAQKSYQDATDKQLDWERGSEKGNKETENMWQ